MPNNSERRRLRTVCVSTTKFETCSAPNCRHNHNLVDSAFLEHIVHSSRTKHPLLNLDGTLAIGYCEADVAQWSIRFMSTLPAGPTVLAQKEGPTLVLALKAMFVDEAHNSDLFTTWSKTVRSRTRCFAHMSDNNCPLDLACKYNHSLVDPQEIVDLITRHGYPGQGFTMSYTDSADPVLGKKWRLVMFVDDSNADADKPWREVSVVHENAHVTLRLHSTCLSRTDATRTRALLL